MFSSAIPHTISALRVYRLLAVNKNLKVLRWWSIEIFRILPKIVLKSGLLGQKRIMKKRATGVCSDTDVECSAKATYVA